MRMNSREVKHCVELLQKCKPGNLAPEIFEAIARVAVYPAVEFIPLRKNGNKIEVLLLERPENDLIWPSMLHTPGTILRPTDATIENAFSRLYEEELRGVSLSQPVFIGAHLSRNRRGTCLLLEHIVETQSEPTEGVFYDVENLPDKFIEAQKPSLERAVTVYRKQY